MIDAMIDPMIELEAGDAYVAISPTDGGRIAQIEVGELSLLKDDRGGGPMTWGSYPMVPWAGRVRHGRFEFGGAPVQLPVNLAPHAIHGTGFVRDWQVVDAGRDYCELRCDLGWQFGGTAHQHFGLDEHGLTCMLSVYAVQQAMPAVVGWHPCLRKPLQADLAFARMYVRDADHIALAELSDPKPHPWDDCFTGAVGPLRLHYPGLTLTVTSDCDHWVVYDEPDDVTCVEPQSGPPDAFNIGGAAHLEPGELLQRHMTFRWGR
jgi:aldose 1-epimerase